MHAFHIVFFFHMIKKHNRFMKHSFYLNADYERKENNFIGFMHKSEIIKN